MVGFGSETPKTNLGYLNSPTHGSEAIEHKGFLLADLGKSRDVFETTLGTASFNFLKKSWNQRPNTSLATSGDQVPLVSSSFIDLKKRTESDLISFGVAKFSGKSPW